MRTALLTLVTPLALFAAGCSYDYSALFDIRFARDVSVPPGTDLLIVDGPYNSVIKTVEVEAGILRYEGEGLVDDSTFHLSAYADLNGNGERDPDEPWGEDPNGFVDIEDNLDYVAVITLENPIEP